MYTKAEIVKKNIFTFFNLIFAVLAALCILAGSYKSLTFLPVVIANTVIGIVQELRAKKILDELSVLNAPTAKVVRGGEVLKIAVEELALGDIAVFAAGDQICADAVVSEGEIYANESLLTGESEEIRKLPGDSLMSGSFVVSGECRASLTAVGQDSYAAKLTAKARELSGSEQSEMIRVLSRLVRAVGIIIVPVGLVMFVQQHVIAGLGVSESIVSMVAALIGMIPEGLFLLTSVALAVSMIRLAQQRVMLHDMKCIETLARVDVLCVDKTGTITDDQMKVKETVPLSVFPFRGRSLEALISDYLAAFPEGNATDKALRERFYSPSGRKADRVFPFSSSHKYAAAAFGDEAFVLGAPEFIMASSGAAEGSSDVPEGPWKAVREALEARRTNTSRVLLFARSEGFSEDGALIGEPQPLALIFIENHIRQNAPAVFGYFREQGVEIKVISGDDPVTVSGVAGQAGIPGAENFVDAQSLVTEEDISSAAEKFTVFGRVKPEQKRSLIKALQAAGHTVGMTGDGVNDVLALKEADCSVAMASGAGAAVQVSKMVLLDSDFAAMPGAVLEGRRVVNNIQRSASLFLVKNIFSLLTALCSMIFAIKYPLIPSQVTLIAAFTIGIPGFFLALAPCKDRIQGSFMKNVLVKALPAGIADAVGVVSLSLIGQKQGIPAAETAAACTIILAWVGLAALVYISRPLNVMRGVLVICCAAGMVLTALLLPGIFEIVPLSAACVKLLLLCGAAGTLTGISAGVLLSRRM